CFDGLLAALVFLCCCGFTRAATAQERYEWRFGGADSPDSYLDVRHVSKQSMNVLGQARDTETTIHLVFKVHIVKSDAEGTVLEHTIIASDDVSKSPGKPDEKGTFKGLSDQKFTVTLKPGARGLEVSGGEAMIEAVFGDDARNAKPNEKKFMGD